MFRPLAALKEAMGVAAKAATPKALYSYAIPALISGAFLFGVARLASNSDVRDAFVEDEIELPSEGFHLPDVKGFLKKIWGERSNPYLWQGWTKGDGKGSYVTNRIAVASMAEAREAALEINKDNITEYLPVGYEPEILWNRTSVGDGPGSADSLPFFPGCKGPGCGGGQQFRNHGMRQCRVTNTASTGAGSLQACLAVVEADSNTANKPLDIITFDVAGYIYWNPTCSQHACSVWRGVEILAQSAPGPIVLTNWAFKDRQASEDIQARGIAVRGVQGTQDLIVIVGKRIVYDHVSGSHGSSRMIRMHGDTTCSGCGYYGEKPGVSWWMQYSHSLFSYHGLQRDRANPIQISPTFAMGNGTPRSRHYQNNNAWLYNLFSSHDVPGENNAYRFPNYNSDHTWFHQNYVYLVDAGNQWSNGNNGPSWDITYNNYKAGSLISSNRSSADYWPLSVQMDTVRLNDLCTDEHDDPYPDNATIQWANCPWSMYIHKNRVDHIFPLADTAQSMNDVLWGTSRYVGVFPGVGGYLPDSGPPPLTYYKQSPWRYTPLDRTFPFPFDTVGLTDANFTAIANDAGAGFRVDSLGNKTMERDPVDTRALEMALNGTNIVQPGDVNLDSFRVDYLPNWDWGSLIHARCRDEENGGAGDGMCDAWEERATGWDDGDLLLSPGTRTRSGYFALELAYAGDITNIDTTFTPPPDATGTEFAEASTYDFLLPAFPGALGYGKYAMNMCRDSVLYYKDDPNKWPLKIWKVGHDVYNDPQGPLGITTLVEDSAKDNQLDVFLIEEGGEYYFTYAFTQLQLEKSCTYISGLPSQGSGAALKYKVDGPYSFQINIGEGRRGLTDVMFRDIHVYGDSGPYPFGDHNIMRLFGGKRLMLDHLSMIGGQDGSEIFGNSDTVQWITYGNLLMGGSFFGDASGSIPAMPGTGTVLDGFDDPTGGDDPLFNFSFIRTAFISNQYRMPIVTSQVSESRPDSFQIMTGPWEMINTMSYDAHSNRIAASYGDDEIDWVSSWLGHGTSTGWSKGPIQVRRCRNTDGGCTNDQQYEWLYAIPGIHAEDLGYYEAKVLQSTNYSLFRVDPDGTTPLPSNFRNASRSPHSLVDAADIWSGSTVPSKLWDSTDPREIVGAARGMTCAGVIYKRRTTTDTWFMNRYKNNTVNSDGQDMRGWGNDVAKTTLTTGSACTDTDGDGLPDAYETLYSASATALDPMDLGDSGYLAIELYLDGRPFTYAEEPSPEPPNPGLCPSGTTYKTNCRMVYILPTELDTVVTNGGADTTISRVANKDSIPLADMPIHHPHYSPDGTEILFVTYDTLPNTLRDSATVHNTLQSWGFIDPDVTLTEEIPGE